MAEPATAIAPVSAPPLRELAWLFLRLGLTAFGGPAAHVAMMEDEVVRRRRWLTRAEFLDFLGATNLIPGPNSTELAIHIGHRRAGWAGLVVAGACFILPAALLTLAFAWAYVRFGSMPAMDGLLYGVKPVIIAVVLQALWGLGRSAVKSVRLGVLGGAAVGAAALGASEIPILFAAGLVSAGLGGFRAGGSNVNVAALAMPAAAPMATLAAGAVTLPKVFLLFAKIGSVLFGSGYVLLAFLRTEFVERAGWLTEGQLIDAVAVGQVTPGPVFTAATFIGYLLDGTPGAAAATVGIFLPAFVFVALSGPLVPRLRASPVAGRFLDGVNVASLALMAVVTAQLGRAALVDPWTVGLAAASALLLFRWRVNSVWLVLGGAVVGIALGT